MEVRLRDWAARPAVRESKPDLRARGIHDGGSHPSCGTWSLRLRRRNFLSECDAHRDDGSSSGG